MIVRPAIFYNKAKWRAQQLSLGLTWIFVFGGGFVVVVFGWPRWSGWRSRYRNLFFTHKSQILRAFAYQSAQHSKIWLMPKKHRLLITHSASGDDGAGRGCGGATQQFHWSPQTGHTRLSSCQSAVAQTLKHVTSH